MAGDDAGGSSRREEGEEDGRSEGRRAGGGGPDCVRDRGEETRTRNSVDQSEMAFFRRVYEPAGPPPATQGMIDALEKKLFEVPTEVEGEAESCVICFDAYEKGVEVAQLPCAHKYHTPCITQWLLKQNTCPICRRPIGEENAGQEKDDQGTETTNITRLQPVVQPPEVPVQPVEPPTAHPVTGTSERNSEGSLQNYRSCRIWLRDERRGATESQPSTEANPSSSSSNAPVPSRSEEPQRVGGLGAGRGWNHRRPCLFLPGSSSAALQTRSEEQERSTSAVAGRGWPRRPCVLVPRNRREDLERDACTWRMLNRERRRNCRLGDENDQGEAAEARRTRRRLENSTRATNAVSREGGPENHTRENHLSQHHSGTLPQPQRDVAQDSSFAMQFPSSRFRARALMLIRLRGAGRNDGDRADDVSNGHSESR